MAEKTKRQKGDEVFWTNIEMESCAEEDAYIPGLSALGNRRPGRIKTRKSKDVQVKLPTNENLISETTNVVKPILKPTKPVAVKGKKVLENSKNSLGNLTEMSTTFESFAERSIQRLQKASLKDLRPEDKQRVANLIKELAKVGEEKDKVVKEWHGEREQYEKQLIVMVEQQERILNERKEIEEKLFQCQTLLTDYQTQLLNKRDQLNTSISDIKEIPDDDYRHKTQPRFNIPDSRVIFNQKQNGNALGIDNRDNESVSELLVSSQEKVKRPFTNLIDNEIARERSLSRDSASSRNSRLGSASPSGGQPRFAYPQKLSGIGPLHEPLAHSTQKSMEIHGQICNSYRAESPRSIIRDHAITCGANCEIRKCESSPASSDNRLNNKVAFKGNTECDDNAEKHSPKLKPGQAFNDPDYAQYYKKLSPGGRKRELLKQRQALLDEQDRLKKVLEKQERQLKERHYEYNKRQELQKERMEFYANGGKFPALKLDFDNVSEKELVSDEERELLEMVPKEIVNADDVELKRNDPDNDIEIDDQVQVKSQVSVGPSPLTILPHGSREPKAVSPVHSHGSQRSVQSDIPKFVDVATSISYRSPLKDASNRQGNLPLYSNRQLQNQESHHASPNRPCASRHPGEKTLNVVELVNSLEDPPISARSGGHNERDRENNPIANLTQNKYLLQEKGSLAHQYRKYISPSQARSTSAKLMDEQDESVEESKILEDIFFL